MPALVYGAPFDDDAESWRHVDDVGASEFKHWYDGKAGDSGEHYRLVRPSDLLKRAQRVRRGDQLLMIDTSAPGKRQRLFDIVEAMQVAPEEGFLGNVFLVKLRVAKEQRDGD